MIEVGKEIEFARHRLNDIIYLAEQTAPVDKADWEGYARSIRNLIASQARQAITALTVLS
jgi:hypothetical protein